LEGCCSTIELHPRRRAFYVRPGVAWQWRPGADPIADEETHLSI
jgi:hypothetical protein